MSVKKFSEARNAKRAPHPFVAAETGERELHRRDVRKHIRALAQGHVFVSENCR